MKKIRRLLFCTLLLILPFISSADPPDPLGPPAPPPCPSPGDPPVGAGIEDGIYVLFSLSALYGSFAIYRNRKKVQLLKRT